MKTSLRNNRIEIDKTATRMEIMDFDEVKVILKGGRVEQKNHFMALMYQTCWRYLDSQYDYSYVQLANTFIRKKLPFEEQELSFMLQAYIHPEIGRFSWFNMLSFYKKVEDHVKVNGLSDSLKAAF